jgi:predicted enzyme related to lactoylglutathione lyase
MVVFVTNGQLKWPFGRENTGYEVDDLSAVLERAKANGAIVLVQPFEEAGRSSAMVQFPGGYIAEIHAVKP